jgi:predicted SnoaL-like aldol condensation-catalyzing enzyme
MENNKKIVIDFLNKVVAGKIEEAYAKYVDMSGKHHNAYYPAGFAALKQGMIENQKQFPLKQFDVKHVVAEGDLVSVHSRVVLIPKEKEVAVVHLFRIFQNKIVEMWDIGQSIAPECPNSDGQF